MFKEEESIGHYQNLPKEDFRFLCLAESQATNTIFDPEDGRRTLEASDIVVAELLTNTLDQGRLRVSLETISPLPGGGTA